MQDERKMKAWAKIQRYMLDNKCLWGYVLLRDYYHNYYLPGRYCNPEFLNIINNNKEEFEIVFGE